MNINRSSRYIPIVAAVGVVVGIIIGTFFANRFSGNRLNIINTTSNKLNDLLHIIDDQYVDTVDIPAIVEQAMPKLLEELDPHSTYIGAKEAKTANDDLKGSFSGIGVQFTIRTDTVRITNIIKGGPSEKVGLIAGDKIISIDGEPYVGKIVTNEETMHRVIEAEKRHEGVFIPFLHFLSCLLKTGKHGAFAAGKVLAGVSVFADFGKDLLHENELIGDEGEVHGKFLWSFVTTNILDGIGETEQISEDRGTFVINGLQPLHGIGLLLQNTLLDDLVHGC